MNNNALNKPIQNALYGLQTTLPLLPPSRAHVLSSVPIFPVPLTVSVERIPPSFNYISGPRRCGEPPSIKLAVFRQKSSIFWTPKSAPPNAGPTPAVSLPPNRLLYLSITT